MRSLASVFAFPLTFVLFGLSGTAPWSAEHVPAPEINVDAPVQGSVESALNAAVSLFTQGEVEAAIDAVRPYLSEDARTVDMLFEVGMITLGAAQTTPPSDAVGRDALLDSSIAVFRAILAAHPEFVRVRLELARAFFLKGRYGLARRNFELALAANPPAPVVANINRHLAMIQARRRWSGYFGMALAPDTNIGAAEDNETILVDAFGQRLPFVRNPEDRVQSGIGLSLWAGGEYQQPLAPNWRLRLGGNVSRREYEGSRFDSMRLGGHVGPRWLVDARTEASLLFTTHRDWGANDKPYSRSLGLRLEAFRRLSPRLSGQLDASWRARRHDTDTRRDGPATDLSIGLRRAMTPTLQANVRAGLGHERPDEKVLRNRTQWLSLGASSTLPRGFNVSGTLTGRWTDYEGRGSPPKNVVDGVTSRKDVTRSIRLSALKRDFTIRGFSPQISVIRERRDSNAQQSDYRRTGGDLSFVRQF